MSRFATLHNGIPLPNGELVAMEDGDVLQLGLFSLIVRLSSPPRAAVTREMPFPDAAATLPVPPHGLIGESAAMREVYAQIRRVAASTLPVLITGASGTGKELTARAIHNASLRRNEPFVPVNAASLGESLCDSVLFGHERGAFTGAVDRTDGAFRQADGGTLFLDEIGELPAAAQARLLRVLETGEVQRVGGTTLDHPDVRILAATHRDLRAGSFREDLYHRIAVARVTLPPLRQRLSDLPMLAEALLEQADRPVRMTTATLQALRNHPWPGNVRELRNVLLSGALGVEDGWLRPENLTLGPAHGRGPRRAAGKQTLERAFEAHERSLRATSLALDIPRTTLRRRLQRLGILS